MSDADCGQALLLQAEFDRELDAAQSAALAAHRETCARCREDWAALTATRAAIAAGSTYHKAPASLRQALEARLGAAAPASRLVPRRARRFWWREGVSFGIGAALAAMLLVAVRPTGDTGDTGVLAALVDDHVRSLQPGHLTDVISTDRHTVKPWFDGKLDFAPPVKDLAAQGYPLVGGRLDYLGGRPVAALAYMHGKHPINLFIWPERDSADNPADRTRDGYNVLHWSADGMALWAVSDLERDELAEFARDWRQMP